MDLVRRTLPELRRRFRLAAGILTGATLSQWIFLCLLLALVLLPTKVCAEKLPLRRFTTADGLPSNAIYCVKRDSQGFLWFCTAEGLSRFDGFRFVNYGVDQGLPDRVVTDFLQTRNGDYWVGTYRGLTKFNPKPPSGSGLFSSVSLSDRETSKRINGLFQDREGVLWVATDDGVYYRTEESGTDRFQHLEPGPGVKQKETDFVAQDHKGNLWIVFGRDNDGMLYKKSPIGAAGELFSDPFFKKNRVTFLFIDKDDRIWLSSYHGLALVAEDPGNGRLLARVYRRQDGLLDDHAGQIFQTSDGKLWVSAGGLMEVLGSGAQVRFKSSELSRQGFVEIDAEDSSGNVWMNATRLTTQGFATYGREDGLRTEDIRSIFEGQDGQLYVVTGTHGQYIHLRDGKRFIGLTPFVPGHNESWDWGAWGWGQMSFQDHLGEWWFATSYGLLRYSKVQRFEDLRRTAPKAFYTTRDGLGADNIFRLYEDSQGDIWISAWGAHSITRWRRATGRFEFLESKDGWDGRLATAFREDRSKNLWIGLWGQTLMRLRQGKIEVFDHNAGFPDGQVNSIWLDHAGRIWAGTSRGGLARIDEPDAARVHFKAYTTRQGLSSNDVRAITEDRWGKIYFWTGKGVDRLEPKSGGLVHYTTEDGLVPAGSDNQEAFCDRNGDLWFGFQGLSRFKPQQEPDDPPALPVFITRIRLRGESLPISELGETSLSGLVFQPSQNNVQIEFGNLNFDTREALRFQYKLLDTDKEWSLPTEVRAVNYSSLRPGNYRFYVRVINGLAQVSANPAVMSFRVLAPVWQRWWFVGLVVLFIAFLGYAAYQFRVNQLLEVERVRTRIASDLHDDVGSGLTQIAILSELAKRETSSGKGEQLSHIANLSRELVDGMGEIVWAMNPQRDQLSDLAQRMRRFASDIFASSGIEFQFAALSGDSNLTLRSDLRRQVYLIFKEAVNNSIRHSGCTRVDLQLAVEGRELQLTISDNGCGVREPQGGSPDGDHHGMENMRKRANSIGGSVEITSKPAGGTQVCLRVPLARKFSDFLKTT